MSAEKTPQQEVLNEITSLVDTYHGFELPAELSLLWEVRRNLVVANAKLVRYVKGAYEKKALSYVFRKYKVAKEIAEALSEDRRTLSKPRPMNMLEVQTEAMDKIVLLKEQQTKAEAEWEEIESTIKTVERVLFAMSQEISDGMKERDYQNHLEGLRMKEQSEQP